MPRQAKRTKRLKRAGRTRDELIVEGLMDLLLGSVECGEIVNGVRKHVHRQLISLYEACMKNDQVDAVESGV